MNRVFLTRNRCVSATPIRALMASSRCGSATPGRPRWTGSVDALGAPGGEPRRDRARIEAELRGHVAGEGSLGPERFEQGPVGDEGVPLRIGRDADLGERMADLGHRSQQREAVRIGARLLGVATDDEGAIDAGALEPGDQLGQVGAVPDHPRRQVGNGAEAAALELLAQGDRRLDPLRRRRGDGDRRARRQERRLVERVLERHELERRASQDAGQRRRTGAE